MPDFASKVESTDGDIVTPCNVQNREGGRQLEGGREGKGKRQENKCKEGREFKKEKENKCNHCETQQNNENNEEKT